MNPHLRALPIQRSSMGREKPKEWCALPELQRRILGFYDAAVGIVCFLVIELKVFRAGRLLVAENVPV